MDPRYHATLASLGQRYQDMPPATFDQRFGPYDTPRPDVPPEAKEQLRRLFEEQMLRDTPEGIIPGQRTWPYGFIQTQAPRPTLQQLAGDVVPGPWGDQYDYVQRMLETIRRQGNQPYNPRPSQIRPPAQIIPFPRQG